MEQKESAAVVNEEEEEQQQQLVEQEEEALLRRKSLRPTNNGNGNGNNGNGVCYSSSDSSESGSAGGDENDSGNKENGEAHKLHSDNSVYFDQHLGVWKCRHCNWTYYMGSPVIGHNQNFKGYLHMPMTVKTHNQQGPCFIFETKGTASIDGVFEMNNGSVTNSTFQTNSRDADVCVKNVEIPKNEMLSCGLVAGAESIDGVPEMKNGSVTCSTFQNSRDADVCVKNVEIEKSVVEDINDHCREKLDNRGFSISLTPLEESREEQKLKSEFLNKESRRAGEFDLIEELDKEETELDVERVLQKQNTHDLYCPNCNSCITRRVILRRRKPKIRNAYRKPKHNRTDRIVRPEIDANNTNSANTEVHETANNSSSIDAASVAVDGNSNREPEVFRCLNCFSFFTCTGDGDGFRLFPWFGHGTENENMPNLQKTPATNRNWFFSIFATDKKKMTNEQAGSDTQTDQNGLVSSTASPPVGMVNESGSASLEARGESANSSVKDNKFFDNASTIVGQKLENATEKVNTDVMLHKDKNVHSASALPGILINNREPAEDASLKPVQGGVDASGTSTNECLVPDLLNIDKDSNTAMEKRPIQNDQASSILEGLNGPEKNIGDEVIVIVETRPAEPPAALQGAQNIDGSTEATSLLQSRTQTNTIEQRGAGISVDILKSIVYGGLIESITSLGVVSSAAGAGSATLNILALGLANLIGGLFIICHNLVELKNDHSDGSSQMEEHERRYQKTLGRKENFSLHATVSILSFLIFGMLPPVLYGFTFRKSDDRDLKLAVVGSVSLVCIFLLATGKAYVQRPPKSYISTILCYVCIGAVASGASYIVGDLIGKLVEKLGWFEPSSAVTMNITERMPFQPERASY